jgi:predicted RNA methylase
MEDISKQIARLQIAAERDPAAMLAIAGAMRKNGQREEAVSVARKALDLAVGNDEITARANAFLAADVAHWHFPMVQDAARNGVYEKALRAVVTPDTRVLEIGAGSGLLAMMAARAGAAEVITCEMNPAIAWKAADIISRNGYSATTRLISKQSQKLDVETDLNGRVDVLVSEILSESLLGEGVLSAHEHAVRELLKPGGRVIPARGSIRVALAEYTGHDETLMGNIEGFDLSPFNQLKCPSIPVDVGSDKLSLRSDANDLFAFDFATEVRCPPARSLINLQSSGGRVNGIIQWIKFDLDETHSYENSPSPSATSAWAARFYHLPAAVETRAGETLEVGGFHDRREVWIWGRESHASK